MKKTLAIVLCLMMIVSAMSVAQLSVSAANSADVVVDTKTAKPGDTVSIELNIKNCSAILAIYLDLEYDTSRLELKSATSSGKIPVFTPSPNLTDMPYALTWNSAENTNYTGDFLLGTLEFEVKAGAANGNADIKISKSATFGDDAAYDLDLNTVELNITNGAITVEGGADPATTTPAPDTTTGNNDNNSTNTGDYIIPVVAIALVAAVAVTVFATKKRSNRA